MRHVYVRPAATMRKEALAIRRDRPAIAAKVEQYKLAVSKAILRSQLITLYAGIGK